MLSIRKINLLASFIIIISYVVVVSLAYYSNNETIIIGTGLIFTYICCSFGGFYIYKPQVWLSIFSFMYSFGANIVNIFDYDYLYNSIYTILLMSLFHVGTCIGLIAFQQEYNSNRSPLRVSNDVINYGIAISTFFVLINNFIFFSSGASSKRQFSDNYDGIGYFGFSYNYFVVFFIFYLILNFQRSRVIPKFIICLCLTISFFTLLNTGERDVFFKIVMATSFIFLYFGVVSKNFIYVIAAAIAIFIPFSKSFGVSLGSSDVGASVHGGNFIVGIMMSDFAASGKNLDLLLLREDLYRDISFSRFISDIVRGVLPTFLSPEDSSGAWFQKFYTPLSIDRHTGGLGFTLAGAFYIYADMIGVFVGAILLAAFVCFLWRKAMERHIYLVFYCSAVPLMIWSLRGDLSTLISSLVKQVALPILLISLASMFFFRSFLNRKG